MNSSSKRTLTAPCGLDCFNCEIYEMNITEEMKTQFAAKIGKEPKDIPCRGCRQGKGCRHLGRPCETLKCIEDKGMEFSFECDEFPCPKLQPAREGADRFPHNTKVFNLCRMKAICVEQWAEEEAALIRRRGVQYDTHVDNIHPLDVGEVADFEGFQVKGLKAVHGPIKLKLFGLIEMETSPEPGERIGLGAVGFEITMGDTVIVNLGDSLLRPEWADLNPDVLMIPIGGGKTHNTINKAEALEAVGMMKPEIVIPCHYDCRVFLFIRISFLDLLQIPHKFPQYPPTDCLD